MKRQAAITGPTPEFIRWSLRRACPLRQDTDLTSVDQTEKRLRGVRTAGAVLQAGTVIDGMAVRHNTDGLWQGFRLSDVFDLWGGEQQVVRLCGRCPANAVHNPELNGEIAGCCGWLGSEVPTQQWHAAVDQCWFAGCPEDWLETNPHWYALWSNGPLFGLGLDFALQLFERLRAHNFSDQTSAEKFCAVLHAARAHHLRVDVELVPAGSSDGIEWTINRHCDRCRAPMDAGRRTCQVCGKPGRGHPQIKKRVLGHRPWVPLETITNRQKFQMIVKQFDELRPSSVGDQP